MNIQRYQKPLTDDLMALLLTADPSREAISKYINDADILVCEMDSKIVGIAVVGCQGDIAELENIAVLSDYQGRGRAKQMIGEIQKLAKRQGATTLIVGTGNSSMSQIALYQKCGFRLYDIDVGYFAAYPEPIFENGIRCLDRVLLRAAL